MMRVARPTTISNRAINRLIITVALVLLVGIPAFFLFYWNDRHVDPGASAADRVIAAAEAAVKASPNDAGARDHLGAAYVSGGRLQDGIDQFTQALKLSTGDRAALLGRAITYRKANQLDLAQADLQTFIAANKDGEFAKTDPQLEQVYYELGVVELLQSHAPDAVTALTSAVAIDASDADALYSLGVALTQSGDPTKGVIALKQAIAFVPTGWSDPYARLGDAYRALGNADGVAYASGMVAFCAGNLDVADTTLKPLIAGAMKTDALIGLALVAAGRGDKTAAVDYYRQALVADPGNESASIGLGALGAAVPAAPSSVPSTGPSPAASPSAGGTN